VIILTLNEEKNLGSCLASLEGLDCEIFIVDSGSTDSTVEIARAHGARVIAHQFENYGAQRNWAQENLPLSAEWVLHLDADERLTPELVREINGVLLGTGDAVDGFLLRKRTVFMGRWIRHGGHYPSYHLRLFRRSRGVCEDRLYDQHFVVAGPVKSLQHDYIDIVASDVFAWTVRHARWAGLEAAELAGRGSGGRQIRAAYWRGPIERRRWLRDRLYGRAPLFARAFLYWFYRYFLRLGFLDGKPGLIFHFLQGCWFRFLVDASLYEGRRAAAEGPAESASGERVAAGRLRSPW
jgi:glycosyltransferase involved in cell wall biosynthesis